MKFRTPGLAGLALAMAVSSVTAGAEEATPKVNADPVNSVVSDETLTVAVASEPSTLWGAAVGKLEGESQLIEGAILDTLIAIDPDTNELVPRLATEWEWTDGTHCTFTLRDDVMMSDGTPLVAEDVVYTATLWKELSPANDTGMYIEGAEAVDEHRVTIAYNAEAPDLLRMMSFSNFGIVSEDEVTALGGPEEASRNPSFGSGKYRFKEWNAGSSIVLERNEEYWDQDYKGYFKEIEFRFANDAFTRAMAVLSGDYDVAYDMAVNIAGNFTENEGLTTYIYPTGQVLHLWYNMGELAGATKDLNVRKAVDLALDFDAIAMLGTNGTEGQSLGYAPEGSLYYTQTFSPEERAVQIDEAKALLEEAGYGNGVELRILGLQDNIPVYTVMQANLALAGITLTIDTPDTASFVESAFSGDYDLICVGDDCSLRTPSLIPFLAKQNIEGSGMVIGGPKWTTDEIDGLISDLIREPDDEAAHGILQNIEAIMKDEVICSNLYPELKAVITNPDIKGMTIRERGYIDVTRIYK